MYAKASTPTLLRVQFSMSTTIYFGPRFRRIQYLGPQKESFVSEAKTRGCILMLVRNKGSRRGGFSFTFQIYTLYNRSAVHGFQTIGGTATIYYNSAVHQRADHPPLPASCPLTILPPINLPPTRVDAMIATQHTVLPPIPLFLAILGRDRTLLILSPTLRTEARPFPSQ